MTTRSAVIRNGLAQVVLLTMALAGCRSTSPDSGPNVDLVDPGTVKQALADFCERFGAMVQTGANEITARADQRAIRRTTVVWKIRMIEDCRRALGHDDLLSVATDIWVLCAQQRGYLTDGAGKNLFGRWQPIAVQAARHCETDFQKMARSVIREDRYDEVRTRIEQFAARHPLQNLFVRDAFRSDRHGPDRASPDRAPPGKANPLSMAAIVNVPLNVLKMPLAPFRAFDDVGSVARSIHEAAQVAAAANQTVSYLPEQTRWQLELLLYDVEDLQTVNELTASVERISRSAESLSGTAARLTDVTGSLPANIRHEATALLTDVDARQAGWQQTLAEARSTMAELDRTVKDTRTIADGLPHTARGLAEAGKAWEGAVNAFDRVVKDLTPEDAPNAPPSPPPAPGETSPPFNINDYARTADNLARAAEKLTTLTREVNTLVTGPRVAERLRDVDRTAQSTLDHLAWRAAQLLVAAFLLALVYRFVRVRLIDPRRGPA